MKKTVNLFFFVLISGWAVAQPVVKGYAWQDRSARGAKPAAVAGEAGNATAKVADGGNLYIYLEFKKTQNIVPYRVWIDGIPYRVSNEKKQSPVIRQTADAGSGFNNDTLVKASSNQVMQVSPVAALTKLSLPPLNDAKADTQDEKIVVEYYWKARRYAFTIPEIKMLASVRLQ